MHHYFHHRCPVEVREHRKFFNQEQRGFGEDALHAMWWLLLRQFKPKRCLEIGVYRGQIISLWSLIARMLNYPCHVHGVSPFSAAGDDVSVYRRDLNYLEDTLGFFQLFDLQVPTLVCSLSTDPPAVAHISGSRWDLIYIDGSHDYEVVFADYCLSRDNLNAGGLLVLDDASIGSAFRPPAFSFAGHPGPSRVCHEIARRELLFLGAVGHNNVFLKPT
jgi:hypothetical protein